MTKMNKWLVVIGALLLIISTAVSGPAAVGQGDAFVLAFLVAAVISGVLAYAVLMLKTKPLVQLGLTYPPGKKNRLDTQIVAITEPGRLPPEKKPPENRPALK